MSTPFFFFLRVVINNLTYLQGYPEQLLSRMRALISGQRLGDVPTKCYPGAHDYTTDRALWQYTQDLKSQFLRNAPPIIRVMYDSKIYVLRNILGLHTAVPCIQGGKPRAKAEIHVVTTSHDAPKPFLRMIAVHELVYLEEKEHNRASYQLCYRMEPQYYQLRFSTRPWLTRLSLGQSKI